MSNYPKERFALEVVFSLVLSAILYAVSDSFEWGLAYWLCLLISVVLVFGGLLILVDLD